MFRSITMLACLGLIVGVSACSQYNDQDYLVTEPISTEPVYTGKYK